MAETDFSAVIDFHSIENNSAENQALIERCTQFETPDPKDSKTGGGGGGGGGGPDGKSESTGCLLPVGARVWRIKGKSGFYVITNAVTAAEQWAWTKTIIRDYSKAAHTNLTNLKKPGADWEAVVKSDADAGGGGDFTAWNELRWSSLGYHYDWTERCYRADWKTPFPKDLNDYAARLARAVGYPSLVCEAGIVNYYPADTSMGAHVDDAELPPNQPIVSISIGNRAVFLLGGPHRSTPPVAMFVRSGDVCVMGGECRMAYHAIPRIITNTVPAALKEAAMSDTTLPARERDLMWEYLSGSRLNFNLRQVVDSEYTFERDLAERAAKKAKAQAHKIVSNAASVYGAKQMTEQLKREADTASGSGSGSGGGGAASTNTAAATKPVATSTNTYSAAAKK